MSTSRYNTRNNNNATTVFRLPSPPAVAVARGQRYTAQEMAAKENKRIENILMLKGYVLDHLRERPDLDLTGRHRVGIELFVRRVADAMGWSGVWVCHIRTIASLADGSETSPARLSMDDVTDSFYFEDRDRKYRFYIAKLDWDHPAGRAKKMLAGDLQASLWKE